MFVYFNFVNSNDSFLYITNKSYSTSLNPSDTKNK